MEIVEEFLHITVDAESLSEATKIGSVKSMEVRGNIKRHYQPPTPSAVVGNVEGNASFPSIFASKLAEFFEYKGWATPREHQCTCQ
ncbi:hypothetical protein GBA52_016539 [Prunus armeniaca]|nr:hypothetical protein GBA52_016539 [Prunus armeniaca]